MRQLKAVTGGQVRVRFVSTFYASARPHHLTRHDVERVLRWPRGIDELTSSKSSTDVASVWFAATPVALPGDPSSILVAVHGRRDDQRGFDAWRVYHRELDLSCVRSAREAFVAFLGRYGVDIVLAGESRRLFLGCTIPMSAEANADPQVVGASTVGGVRIFRSLRLVPERAEIDVGAVFAIDEAAVLGDLAHHRWRSPPEHPESPSIPTSNGKGPKGRNRRHH